MLHRPIGNLVKLCSAARHGAITSASGPDICRQYHNVVGDVITPSQILGIDHLRDPRMNKGLAFTLEERQTLGIHGLQPPRFKSQEEQLELCKISLNSYKIDLNKYLYLSDLHDRNERLFFRLLSENIEELLPIVYTPTVGLACQKFGLIYRRPHGLFITINDKGHVYDVLKNWPEPDVKAICVTDGERVLGLGDLGAAGMGIPVGKLALYTALAGIHPHRCLPILIDVGTDNQNQLEDPLYVGLRQNRVRGDAYWSLLDEFMEAVVKRYGYTTLVQFEDFGTPNAFKALDRYRDDYCVFNDDIQGTSAVVLAGVKASQRITGKKMSDSVILFVGAGGAAQGIADLCVMDIASEGLSLEEARKNIWMSDVDGLITKSRGEAELDGHKAYYAKDVEPIKDLAKMINTIKPNILIGASASGGIFTEEVLKNMAAINERPIVFALSNPTSKAECTAEQAYKFTEGRAIFSSGSPFSPVTYNGRTFHPGQGNNAYIFPGVAFGVISSGMSSIPNEIFLIAASEVAKFTEQSDLEKGSLYPSLSKIREVSLRIAVAVVDCAYSKGLASGGPEPKEKRKWLERQLYNHNYESSMPVAWGWPNTPVLKTRPLEPTKIFKDEK